MYVGVSWSVGIAVLLESDEQATFQEWQAAVDAALRDPAFRRGMGVVHDMRRLIRVPTSAEARARVDFLLGRTRAFQVSRWAIVVSGSAHYGMGRMAEFLTKETLGDGFRVFRDLPEALEWARCGSAENGSVA